MAKIIAATMTMLLLAVSIMATTSTDNEIPTATVTLVTDFQQLTGPLTGSNDCYATASFFTQTGETTADRCGGVTVTGDHRFYGDLPAIDVVPVAPVVEIVPSFGGNGYVMFAQDGGVFGFGDVEFLGSVPGLGVLDATIVSGASFAAGYSMYDEDGTLYAFPRNREVGVVESAGNDCDNWVFRAGDQFNQFGRLVSANGHVLTQEVLDVTCEHFGDLGVHNEMVQVAMCESGGDPLADNGTDTGLFQINDIAHRHRIIDLGAGSFSSGRERLFDPDVNASVARAVYDEGERLWGSGLRPWSCTSRIGSALGQRVGA